ncbi:MAG: hypothetical protein B6D63_05475 [Candidatus Latescibacteria bacterium 4484_7]|nr:MAG: hypothetical protein B6D63_05475 [Candidatus Latescibacteria bacterium 4484_7]
MGLNREIIEDIIEALKYIDDGILVTDWNGMILYTNRSLLERQGLDPAKNYMGKSLREILPDIMHPVLDEFREHLLKYGKYEKKFDMEALSGNKIILQAISTLVTRAGLSVTVSVLRDITELERAKRELEERSKQLAVLNGIYSYSNMQHQPVELLTHLMNSLRDFCGGKAFGIYRVCHDGENAKLVASYGLNDDIIEDIKIVKMDSPVQKAIMKFERAIVIEEEVKEDMSGRRWVREKIGLNRTVAFTFRVRGNIVYLAYIGLGDDRDVPKKVVDFLSLARDQLNMLLEREYLLEELSKREKELKNLASGLLETVENERRDIAMLLHNETEQYIAATNVELDLIDERLRSADEGVRESIDAIRENLLHISRSARNVSYALHPAMLEDLGLIPTLQWFIEEFVENEALSVDFEAAGFDERLPEDVAIILYRVAQEALTNVLKHSGATNVCVNITKGYPDVIMVVQDNGKGFDPETVEDGGGGLGIIGMKERVASLGGPGEGTRIRVTIPIEVNHG